MHLLSSMSVSQSDLVCHIYFIRLYPTVNPTSEEATTGGQKKLNATGVFSPGSATCHLLSGSVRCAPGSVEKLCCGYESTDELADEWKNNYYNNYPQV